MRVVHINADAGRTGGASIAMCRLHRMFCDMGIDSVILCRSLPFEPGAEIVSRSIPWAIVRFCWRVFMKLYAGICYPTGLLPTGLSRKINAYKPDLVVLHWIQNDTMSVSEIMQIRAPVIWFHHDLWPILGLMPHSYFVVPRHCLWLDRLSRWNKRRIANRMGGHLLPVCASRWCEEEIKRSGMFQMAPSVIPLLIDPCFRNGIRRGHAKFRILNGAFGGFQSGVKGGDRLLSALKMIPADERCKMEVVFFGCDGEERIDDGVEIRFVGRLTGERLAQEYRDADVFAFPSRQETFGQTKIESLFCGTPVVAFDESACAEGLIHRGNGWVAPSNDVGSFADGIRHYYHAWRNGQPIRVKPLSAYLAENVSQKWRDLLAKYEEE